MPAITNSNVITASTQILDGIVTNADVATNAAIAYSKLNLATSIVNADISASAAIAYSKLNLATSIVNADISASAAIADTKLDTIATAGKVSGAALTSLSSIPAGAGQIPSANLGAAMAHAAGTNVIASSDAEATQQNIGGLTEVKAFVLSSLVNGTITVDFDIHDELSGGAQAQIYKNGSAAGTLRSAAGNTSYQTFSENISVSSGDRISLYWNNTVANKQVYVRNFRIKSSKYEVTTRVVGSA